MPKLSALEELVQGVTSAADHAEKGQRSREIAEQFCESERHLVKPFLLEWAIEKIAAMVRARRSEVRRASDTQLQLEIGLGFERLPARIVLKSGERVSRKEATIGQFREQRALLFKAKNPKVEELDRAIELMEKYTRREPDITWAEVLEREAGKKTKVTK